MPSRAAVKRQDAFQKQPSSRLQRACRADLLQAMTVRGLCSEGLTVPQTRETLRQADPIFVTHVEKAQVDRPVFVFEGLALRPSAEDGRPGLVQRWSHQGSDAGVDSPSRPECCSLRATRHSWAAPRPETRVAANGHGEGHLDVRPQYGTAEVAVGGLGADGAERVKWIDPCAVSDAFDNTSGFPKHVVKFL